MPHPIYILLLTSSFWERWREELIIKLKDSTEKTFIALNDVFTDIFNVLVFGGKQIITPDSLEDITGISQYKADDSKLHEPDPAIITHVDEFLKLMQVLTGDSRYETIMFTEQEKKEGIGMCKVLDAREKLYQEYGIA